MTSRLAPLTTLFSRGIVTAGGVGYSPVAPGTCGTLVAVPIAWACRDLGTWMFLAVVAIVTMSGVIAARHALRGWGTHDDQRIVIDEVAGYLLTVAFVDRSSGWMLAVAFGLFRLLDIKKPGPIRWIDRNVPGATGVMLDDLAAGAVGAVVMVGVALLAGY
jgi:phosphatidylglycerophosphatase A